MKVFKWLFFGILGAIVLFLITSILFYIFSPRILATTIFKGQKVVVPIELISNFDDIESNAIIYDEKNEMDYIRPKMLSGNESTIIWVHGGGFVGGYKNDLFDYMRVLAVNNNIVFSINYELATKAKFPGPIKNLSSVYKYIETNAATLGVDLTSIYIGGDSAGANIVSQFLLVQENEEFAKNIKLEPVVKTGNTIKGAILFSGFYDLATTYDDMSFISSIAMQRVMWEYTGKFNAVKEISSIDNFKETTTRFFISDGTKNTFANQSKLLAEKLESLNVDVNNLIYDADLEHNYMFNLSNIYSFLLLNELISFIY